MSRVKAMIGMAGALAIMSPSVARCLKARENFVASRAATPDVSIRVLQASLDMLASRAAPGAFGVAVLDLQSGGITGVGLDRSFPMQSVFKAPLGAAVFAAIDAGRLSLDQRVTLTRADLSPPYSPIAEAWPRRETYTVRELLELTVGGSDNTGADVLMRMMGGPAVVTRMLRGQGVSGMRIDRYEREFQPQASGMGPFRQAWIGETAFVAARDAVPPARRRAALAVYLADPRDTATPRGSVAFLSRLASGRMLSPASTAALLGIMTRSQTGGARLTAGLPPGATIAHKTGTGRTDLGVSPAANHIGIVTLAGGRRFAVASYLAGSSQPEAARDRLHADAAHAAVAAMAQSGS